MPNLLDDVRGSLSIESSESLAEKARARAVVWASAGDVRSPTQQSLPNRANIPDPTVYGGIGPTGLTSLNMTAYAISDEIINLQGDQVRANVLLSTTWGEYVTANPGLAGMFGDRNGDATFAVRKRDGDLDHRLSVYFFSTNGYHTAICADPIPDEAIGVAVRRTIAIPGIYTVIFWYTEDGETWKSVGNVLGQVITGVGTLDDTDHFSLCGQDGAGGSDALIKSVEVIVDGVTVASPNFDDQPEGTATFLDEQGNRWNIVDTAPEIGRIVSGAEAGAEITDHGLSLAPIPSNRAVWDESIDFTGDVLVEVEFVERWGDLGVAGTIRGFVGDRSGAVGASMAFRHRDGANLELYWINGAGDFHVGAATAATPDHAVAVAGQRTINDNGTTTVEFFYRPEQAAAWLPIGTPQVIATPHGIGAAGQPLAVGADGASWAYLDTTIRSVRLVADGEVVASPDFAAQKPGAPFFHDAQGNRWDIRSTGQAASDASLEVDQPIKIRGGDGLPTERLTVETVPETTLKTGPGLTFYLDVAVYITDATFPRLLSCGESSGVGFYLYSYDKDHSNAGRLTLLIDDGPVTELIQTPTANRFRSGDRLRLAGRVDVAAQTLTFLTTLHTDLQTDSTSGLAEVEIDSAIILGCRSVTDANGGPIDIYEFLFWNEALTDDELRAFVR